MYETFYGLKDKPFSMLPDPGFLYLSKKHQAALTLLEYALYNNAGFCVISGDIGAGKTTLLRKLLENMESNVTVGMITNTHQSFGELLDWVLAAFDIHKAGLNKVEMHQVFVDFLMQQYAQDKTALLIVDEAQNMDVETLEELRMLSNINSEKDQLLQVILAGQPELKQTMRLPALKQFVQRIAVDYHLGPLNLEETFGYIQHRLITAGAKRNVFTPLACQRIYEYSGGIPRLINLLCDTSMVYGFADQVKLIGENLVDDMVRERMADSLVPLVRSAPVAEDKGGASEQSKKNASPDARSAQRNAKQPAASAHLSQVSGEQIKQGAKAQAEKKTAAKTLKPVAVVATHTGQQALNLKPGEARPEPAEEQLSQHEPGADFDIALDTEPATNTATAKHGSKATRPGSKKNTAGKIKPDELKPVFDVEAKLKAEAEARTLAQAAFLPEAEEINPAPAARHVENHIEVLQPAPVAESKLFDKWTLLILAILVLVVLYLVMPDIDFESAPQEIATEPAGKAVPAAELEAETEKTAGAENELSESIKLKLEEAEKLKLEMEQMRLDERARLEQIEAQSRLLQQQRDEAVSRAEQEKQERLKKAEEVKQAAARARALEAKQAKIQAEMEAARARAQQEAEIKQRAAVEAARKQATEQEVKRAIEEEARRVRELELEWRDAQRQAVPSSTSTTAGSQSAAPWKKPEASSAAANAEADAAASAVKAEREQASPEFVLDPCQGPSAKFLSTCRK